MMTYEEILKIKDDARRDATMAYQFDHYNFMDCLEHFDGDPVEEFLRVFEFDRAASIAWWRETLEEYGEEAGEEAEAIRSHISMMEANT